MIEAGSRLHNLHHSDAILKMDQDLWAAFNLDPVLSVSTRPKTMPLQRWVARSLSRKTISLRFILGMVQRKMLSILGMV